jgi:hypothetical protein
MGTRLRLAAALALPLVAIAIGIVRGELHLAHGRRWVCDVAGYDPRDPLQGHYLAYRIELNEAAPIEECSDAAGEDCCFCLIDQGRDVPPQVQRATCPTARERCDGTLRTRDLESLRRYYIAEADAARLTTRLLEAVREKRAHLAVRIDGDGHARVERILVDGEPLENVIR